MQTVRPAAHMRWQRKLGERRLCGYRRPSHSLLNQLTLPHRYLEGISTRSMSLQQCEDIRLNYAGRPPADAESYDFIAIGVHQLAANMLGVRLDRGSSQMNITTTAVASEAKPATEIGQPRVIAN